MESRSPFKGKHFKADVTCRKLLGILDNLVKNSPKDRNLIRYSFKVPDFQSNKVKIPKLSINSRKINSVPKRSSNYTSPVPLFQTETLNYNYRPYSARKESPHNRTKENTLAEQYSSYRKAVLKDLNVKGNSVAYQNKPKSRLGNRPKLPKSVFNNKPIIKYLEKLKPKSSTLRKNYKDPAKSSKKKVVFSRKPSQLALTPDQLIS